MFVPFGLRSAKDAPSGWLPWLGRALTSGAPAPLPPLPGDVIQALPFMESHGVTPLVYLRLRDDPLWLTFPLAVQNRLAAAFRANATRAYGLETELHAIVGALSAKRVPVMLLKGAAVGRLLYASLAERPLSDLDLLVQARDADQAREVLEGMGYGALGLRGNERIRRWQRRYRCEQALVSGKPSSRGLLVELHWSLAEIPYYIDRIPMGGIWVFSQAASEPQGARVPDAATLLLHSCAHLALHHSRDLRLIWLLDVDRILRWKEFRWERALALGNEWGLGLALQAAVRATIRWIGTPVPADALAELDRQAADPPGSATWGLGDETPGRGWRRARATWSLFSPKQRVRYASWLALRLLSRPAEARENQRVLRRLGISR